MDVAVPEIIIMLVDLGDADEVDAELEMESTELGLRDPDAVDVERFEMITACPSVRRLVESLQQSATSFVWQHQVPDSSGGHSPISSPLSSG